MVCLPNTKPVIDDMSVLEFIARRARQQGLAKVYCYGAITKGLEGNELAEMGLLAGSGAVAFTDGLKSVTNAQVMRRALDYAATFGFLIVQHAEEPSLAKGGMMNAGETATRMGLSGIPRQAEVIMAERDIEKIIAIARSAGAKILVDDAGGARVGPAVFNQPKSLEFDVDIASTGLDKYGTIGPRLGLLAGDAQLVADIRATAFELGVEARPMLYPAVVNSLAQYDPQRVRDLVATTKEIAEVMKSRFGNRVSETPVTAQLKGEDILEMAMERAGIAERPAMPIEATAGLAMAMARNHGILSVHLAGLPPGTSALLFKFIPPETLKRFGGADHFVDAVDRSIDTLAAAITDPASMRLLLYGESDTA